ncbi:xanthine dehydrogenase [Chaetoceros tenuissimus]|uniref:Xanthine dehydrogenase n=1 Tax=Chaetoceros tenuissimus TaxID=426638 RepID=A0AAD3D5H0_9STRA|nr:xanthine dehydrogenase [Chaetoceros tenuissimus]
MVKSMKDPLVLCGVIGDGTMVRVVWDSKSSKLLGSLEGKDCFRGTSSSLKVLSPRPVATITDALALQRNKSYFYTVASPLSGVVQIKVKLAGGGGICTRQESIYINEGNTNRDVPLASQSRDPNLESSNIRVDHGVVPSPSDDLPQPVSTSQAPPSLNPSIVEEEQENVSPSANRVASVASPQSVTASQAPPSLNPLSIDEEKQGIELRGNVERAEIESSINDENEVETTSAANKVQFWLNGNKIVVENPSPTLLLIDYLRSPEVGLTGAKKGCGQGGCGACTCILSEYNKETQEPIHRAINSCLRPVCSLDGLVVTTVEGTGGKPKRIPAKIGQSLQHSRAGVRPGVLTPATLKAHEELKQYKNSRGSDNKKSGKTNEDDGGIVRFRQKKGRSLKVNPVARALAENNGSQCGYCSTGFVMNMTGHMQSCPNSTMKDIEDLFDGNICRCTGYRPILTAMKTFASDWGEEEEKNRMKCEVEDDDDPLDPTNFIPTIPFPPEATRSNTPSHLNIQGKSNTTWLTAESLGALSRELKDGNNKNVHLVNGNTSFGMYPEEFTGSIQSTNHTLINIADMATLKHAPKMVNEDGRFEFGAGLTYSNLISYLSKVGSKIDDTNSLGAILYMARRTAGTIVRNAATVGGNTMLVLKHIHEGDPFPSDLFSVLFALNARIIYCSLLDTENTIVETCSDLVERIKKPEDKDLPWRILIKSYEVPIKDDFIMPNKTAMREVNSHSIVNSAIVLPIDKDGHVSEDVKIVFGGIAPYPWCAVECEWNLVGKTLQDALKNFETIATALKQEVTDELKRHAKRMISVPNEGITDEYKANLAIGFLYKALVRAQSNDVSDRLKSAGDTVWGNWPVTNGKQRPMPENSSNKSSEINNDAIRKPYIKISALDQTTGHTRYTHEIQVPKRTLNGAFVQSLHALKSFSLDAGPEFEQKLSHELGFSIYLIDHKDVPAHGKNLQGMGGDQPLFAENVVQYVGQAIALVLADTEHQATHAATFIANNYVKYSEIGGDYKNEWSQPILTVGEARRKNSIYPDFCVHYPFMSHLWKLTRPRSQLDWSYGDDETALIDGVECAIVRSKIKTGRQLHFYMETQAAVAIPLDDNRMKAFPSSQSPAECHQTCVDAIAVESNKVEIEIRQLGGSYGGKTEQSRFIVGPAVVAANKIQRPVRIVMEREADSAMMGQRGGIEGESWIAIDKNGIVHGLRSEIYMDGGSFLDCSFVVTNCIQLRTDNAYFVRNFETQIDVCRTNTQPTTAFRGFGDLQGMLMIETAWDDAITVLNKDADSDSYIDPLEVRMRNLYKRGEVTPFGQTLTYCYMREVLQFAQKVTEYEEKKKDVIEFNRLNRWKKRGIYMLPIKYGSGYNLKMLEQASCMISVYSSDGTIMINQSGVDCGQGLRTKLLQVAAYVLNLPLDYIQIQFPKTSVIPNPTSTGASTGTSFNGEAVRRVCQELRGRILNFGYSLRTEYGEQWCKNNGVDFWNYTNAWRHELQDGQLVWQKLIQHANSERVNLTVASNVKIKGGEEALPVGTFKTPTGQPSLPYYEVLQYDSKPIAYPRNPSAPDKFTGFTYSAACCEVEVDIITGETKILKSSLIYDCGLSINPALDIGQIEGAFMMGVGYVLSEKVVYEDRKDNKNYGSMNTVNTWRYKPPATSTVPINLDVYMFPRSASNISDLPENPNDFLSSKEVGEPPLILSAAVFFAIKDAIRSYRKETSQSELFELNAPATVQEVRRACGNLFSDTTHVAS